MERIKNILQRLQDVYYGKHQKSAIDVDLMMDYTRVMYADLMEWRKQFKEPPTTEVAEKNTEVITSGAEQKEVTTPVPEATATTTSATTPESVPQPEQKEMPAKEAPAPVTTPVPEPHAPAGTTEDRANNTIVERDEPPVREPQPEVEEPVTDLYPDQGKVEILMTDATGISFEPPAQHEVKSEVKEDVLVEEAPAVNQTVEEIVAPAPVAIPLPDMQPLPARPEAAKSLDLLHAAKAANRDVRSAIGINDKYLFLNELFNNHKSNYEETLDKLNHFSTLEQAEDWIRTKVAPVQKWDHDDATVQGFYAMLSKHFSAR